MPCPPPIRRHFFRSSAVPCSNRGYQTNGTTIVRPSSSATINSSSVTFTSWAFASRSSIAKVLIPLLQNHRLSLFHQLLNPPGFVGTKTAAVLQSYWVKPELGNFPFPFHMNMRWLISITGVEEETVWTYIGYCRGHSKPMAFRGIRKLRIWSANKVTFVSLPSSLLDCLDTDVPCAPPNGAAAATQGHLLGNLFRCASSLRFARSSAASAPAQC
ncbi:MAG: hypothetical protein KatS3mg050_3196 [Litorilinea sp.]|nr:MAG: hypothetical protein KatS3mg050_3196 [Litorilinea sp.]